MSTLKLLIHGQVYQFEVPSSFDMDRLNEYCEIENIKKDSNLIYAKVNFFIRPFSELRSALVEAV